MVECFSLYLYQQSLCLLTHEVPCASEYLNPLNVEPTHSPCCHHHDQPDLLLPNFLFRHLSSVPFLVMFPPHKLVISFSHLSLLLLAIHYAAAECWPFHADDSTRSLFFFFPDPLTHTQNLSPPTSDIAHRLPFVHHLFLSICLHAYLVCNLSSTLLLETITPFRFHPSSHPSHSLHQVAPFSH